MLNVEKAMNEVMDVYRSVTGRAIQPGRTELPPEVDPTAHVEARYRELKTLLRTPSVSAPSPMGATWAPPCDVYELEREVRCEVELPGVTHDRITLSLTGDWLVIRGERAAPAPTAGRTLTTERSRGPFQKMIAMPRLARREAVEAVLQDGVLFITIPMDGEGTGTTREVRVAVKSA
jgi:HSP20 family protein